MGCRKEKEKEKKRSKFDAIRKKCLTSRPEAAHLRSRVLSAPFSSSFLSWRGGGSTPGGRARTASWLCRSGRAGEGPRPRPRRRRTRRPPRLWRRRRRRRAPRGGDGGGGRGPGEEEEEEEEEEDGRAPRRRRRSKGRRGRRSNRPSVQASSTLFLFTRSCACAATQSLSCLSLFSVTLADGDVKGKRELFSQIENAFSFLSFFFEKKNEGIGQSFLEAGIESTKRQQKKNKTKKTMPASLLRSASARAAVAAPPARSASFPRTPAVPARTPVGVAATGGRLLQRRRNHASSMTTAKAMPTATTAATPAAAEQRPIPGEDLFMVREDRVRSPSSVEMFWRALGKRRQLGSGDADSTLGGGCAPRG